MAVYDKKKTNKKKTRWSIRPGNIALLDYVKYQLQRLRSACSHCSSSTTTSATTLTMVIATVMMMMTIEIMTRKIITKAICATTMMKEDRYSFHLYHHLYQCHRLDEGGRQFAQAPRLSPKSRECWPKPHRSYGVWTL